MSAIKSRQQQDMSCALEHIAGIKDEPYAKAYGRLCHKVPILVQTNGLCQTLAFISDKGTGNGDDASACKTLLDHIGDVLETPGSELLNTVRKAPLTDYMRMTRRIMTAWVFYKRFSVSILDIENSEGDS